MSRFGNVREGGLARVDCVMQRPTYKKDQRDRVKRDVRIQLG